MSNLAEDVQDRAMDKFLVLVTTGNQSLGEKLARNRGVIFRRAMLHIQSVGVTEYAARVLNYRSDERDGLEFLIDD